jgi:hypothetical protein
MQLVDGDPTTQIPIEWYWAPDGAQFLGGAFASSNWDYDKLDSDPTTGEQGSAPRTYSKGVNIWGYKGICQLGTDEQFANGLTRQEFDNPPLDVPDCCRPGGPIVFYVSSWKNLDGTLLYNQPTGDVVAEVNQASAFTWSGFHTFNNSVTIDLSSNPLVFFLQCFGNVGHGRASVFFVSGNGVSHFNGTVEIGGDLLAAPSALRVGAGTGQVALQIQGNGTLALTNDAINATNHAVGTLFRLDQNGKLCTNQSVAVGAAGTAVAMIPFYDVTGTLLGYAPLYDTGPDSGGGGTGTVIPSQNDFRLTLTTGTAVTTADVIAAGTVYLTPYKGEHISTYDSSAWADHSSAEISLALAIASGSNYDVFAFFSAGLQLELSAAWASDTTRTDAIAMQDGVWVKSADHSRRLVGTIRGSGPNVTEDSALRRFCWNATNRVSRDMVVVEPAFFWNPATAGIWEPYNSNTANRVEWVVGLSEDSLTVVARGAADAGGAGFQTTGIGLDSTSSNAAQVVVPVDTQTNVVIPTTAEYRGYPGIGHHFAQWLEWGNVFAASRFWGTFTTSLPANCGLSGIVMG